MIEEIENRIKQQLQQQGIEYLQAIGNLIFHDQQKINELIKEHEHFEDLEFYGLQTVYESYDAGTEMEVIRNDMKAMYGDGIIEEFFKEQSLRFKIRKEEW